MASKTVPLWDRDVIRHVISSGFSQKLTRRNCDNCAGVLETSRYNAAHANEEITSR